MSYHLQLLFMPAVILNASANLDEQIVDYRKRYLSINPLQQLLLSFAAIDVNGGSSHRAIFRTVYRYIIGLCD